MRKTFDQIKAKSCRSWAIIKLNTSHNEREWVFTSRSLVESTNYIFKSPKLLPPYSQKKFFFFFFKNSGIFLRDFPCCRAEKNYRFLD